MDETNSWNDDKHSGLAILALDQTIDVKTSNMVIKRQIPQSSLDQKPSTSKKSATDNWISKVSFESTNSVKYYPQDLVSVSSKINQGHAKLSSALKKTTDACRSAQLSLRHSNIINNELKQTISLVQKKSDEEIERSLKRELLVEEPGKVNCEVHVLWMRLDHRQYRSMPEDFEQENTNLIASLNTTKNKWLMKECKLHRKIRELTEELECKQRNEKLLSANLEKMKENQELISKEKDQALADFELINTQLFETEADFTKVVLEKEKLSRKLGSFEDKVSAEQFKFDKDTQVMSQERNELGCELNVVKTLNKECERTLKEKVDEVQKELGHIQEDSSNLTVGSMKQDLLLLEKIEKKIEALSKEKLYWRSQFEESQCKLNSLRVDFNRSVWTCTEQTAQINALQMEHRNSLNELNQTCKQFEQCLIEKEILCTKLRQALENFAIRLKTTQNSVAVLNQEKTAIVQNAADREKKLADLVQVKTAQSAEQQKQIEAMELAFELKKDELREAAKKIDCLCIEAEAKQFVITELKENTVLMLDSQKTLNALLEEKCQLVENLQKQNESTKILLQTERLNLAKEKELREQEKAQDIAIIQALKENNKLLKREAEKVNTSMQESKVREQLKDADISEARKRNETLLLNNIDLKKQLSNLLDKNTNDLELERLHHGESMTALNEKLKVIQEYHSSTELKLIDARKEITDKENNLANLASICSNLVLDLEKKEIDISKLQKESNQLRLELERKTNSLTEVKKSLVEEEKKSAIQRDQIGNFEKTVSL